MTRAKCEMENKFMTVNEEIERSTEFGQELEDLIVKRGTLTFVDQTRDRILLAYWSLVFDYDKSILNLLRAGFYGGAFALVRPTVEALIRAHVALIGSDDDIAKITHSGLSQLGRRYTGGDLQARYEDGEIIEVIHVSTSAVYVATNLVTNRFTLSESMKAALHFDDTRLRIENSTETKQRVAQSSTTLFAISNRWLLSKNVLR